MRKLHLIMVHCKLHNEVRNTIQCNQAKIASGGAKPLPTTPASLNANDNFRARGMLANGTRLSIIPGGRSKSSGYCRRSRASSKSRDLWSGKM